jgi:hypothetical protein
MLATSSWTAAPADAYATCTSKGTFSRQVGAAFYFVDLPIANPYKDPNCVMGDWMGSTAYESVRTLQRALNTCYTKGLVVDGKFGPATKRALVSVQREVGTAEDGVYGPNTMRAMAWPQYSGGLGKGCVAGRYYQ